MYRTKVKLVTEFSARLVLIFHIIMQHRTRNVKSCTVRLVALHVLERLALHTSNPEVPAVTTPNNTPKVFGSVAGFKYVMSFEVSLKPGPCTTLSLEGNNISLSQ